MKEKLIHTRILSKYDHSSTVGIITATHLEYCNFMYKYLRGNTATFENFYKCILENILNTITIFLIPIFILTHGFILYPYYIYRHIKIRREFIKKYGIEKLNIDAILLAKRLDDEHAKDE